MQLSSAQKQIYDMEKVVGKSVGVICGYVLTKNKYDVKDMKDAINKIFCINDALRIKIDFSAKEMSQTICEYTKKEIDVLFFESRDDLHKFTDTMSKKPLNVNDCLCDIKAISSNDFCGIFYRVHHIVSDGWSLAHVTKQFFDILEKQPIDAFSYADYIGEEHQYLKSRRAERDKAYFIEKIQQCDDPTFFFDAPPSVHESRRKRLAIDKRISHKIKNFGEKNNISTYLLFFTIVNLFFSKLKNNVEKFFIGTTVFNRATQIQQNTVGMFVNTVPFLVEFNFSENFYSNLTRTQNNIFSLFRHQKFNYTDILSSINGKKLFDVMFNYQNNTLSGYGLESKWYHNGLLSNSLEIHVDDRDDNGIFRINYDYQTDKFTEHDINILHQRLVALICDAIENPEKPLYELEYLTEEEKNTILKDFNNTKADYTKDKCVHTLFEEIAKANADTKAIIASDKTLTYSELNEESNRIANALIEKGVKSGDIVAFVLNRRSYVLSTMLGILKTGAAYLPIDPDYPQDRIQYVLNDSNAKFCVTEENINELLEYSVSSNPNIETTSDSICYCIYTSGSTGNPKGTLITHKNVVNYASRNEHNVLGGIITDEKNILSVTTTGFDIFVTESLLPLTNGLTVILADEEESRIQNKLAKLITSTNAEVIQTTPTKMKAFISNKDNLDYLKQLKVIILGGEALDKSLVDELKTITDAKIFNIYGPTETTVWSTFTEVEEDVTIGKPIANTQVYITDNYNNIVPIGVTGELCIAGDGVCAGYLNNEQLTNEKFIDNPFGTGKLYKTGDLAYWRNDGNICYVGRNDFQVKIRGQRIELGEIENAISSVDGVVQCAVIVREDNDNRQYICAFYTGEETDAKDFRTILSSKLPKYMVPHIFVNIDEMPLTSSGKINRNNLPEIDLNSISTETEYVAPTTEKENILVSAIEKVLKIEKVSVLDNFFDLGGDSLKSIELVSEIEDKGYTVNVKTIFEAINIQELSKELTEKTEKEETVEYSSVLPATSAQMRVYTSQFMSPDSTHYNISYMFSVEELDVDRLEVAINKLIDRHESLRTSFENRNGQVVQVINDNVSVTVEKLNSSNPNEFIRPFNLNSAPLLRVGVYANTVMIDMHHIIDDGSSSAIFFKELNELYMDRELKTPVQYGEFAVTNTYTEDDEKYWLDVFSEEQSTLELSLDYSRPETQSFNGANIYTRIDNKLNEKILNKCKLLGITPYAYYMACYNILLSKFSGNEDICVGVPTSGRTSKFLNTMGMFVNTLALRNQPTGTKTFLQFANEVKDNSINAINHQNYPQQELVKKTNNKKALYDVMFAYQSEEMTEITLGDKKAEVIPTPINSSKCDLSFYVYPRQNETVLMTEYCTDLYKEQTINKFINAYNSILSQSLDETKQIKDISILTSEEESLLSSFNNTTYTYNIPDNSTLYSLFEKASKENKDKVCIMANDSEITFADFKAYAERIDNAVRNITDEKSVIAVICERSFEMYGAIYGIIRGGNAYLPIDPNYPQDRIDYILENSRAKAVITQDKFAHLVKNIPCIDATAILNSNETVEKTACKAEENDTAYVIYTSGSTGNPKGAKISHKSAINRILWMHDFYPLEENDVILQKTPYTFDVSVWELFWWGITGRTLCASKPDEHFLPAKILEETEKNKVTHLHFVPSVFDLFLTYLENNPEEQYKFNSVKYVFLSGEALTANHISRFYNIYDYNKVELHNLYGPTECAVDVSYYPCVPTDIDPVPIGKPIYNTQLHIVDKYLNPTPMGVIGELCIAGVNVGQGYLNNKQLTNEKFIDNPFGTGKLYKTGDLAYWRNDGNICYVGRMDGQVKIHGQRIELGEIEKVIDEVSSVEAVAVIVKQNNGQDVLVAFCCGNENSINEIFKHCENKLPQYMIPGKFQFIEKMPLNQSGKLDRKALNAIEVVFDDTSIKEEPVTETEKLICGLFQETLGIDVVGRNENFFTLGGTSLDMISILSENMLQNISAADFIANPTPEKLAKILDSGIIEDSDGFYTLRNVPSSTKALVLFPYAGGDASAFAALTKELEEKSSELSLYYVDYLRSYNQCEIVAEKISELAKFKEINIYSHCAGTAVALQVINILENKGVAVSHYITGGFIPPAKPVKRNSWNYVPKQFIQNKLLRAGAPIEKFTTKHKFDMVEKFRKDTDFMAEYFYRTIEKINAPMSVIISKTDIFTKNYEQTDALWKTRALNYNKTYYIDADTHYFQTEKSDEVSDIILNEINT